MKTPTSAAELAKLAEQLRPSPIAKTDEPYRNPVFFDAEGKKLVRGGDILEPTAAWTRDGDEMIPVLALPLRDFTVIDCDDATAHFDKSRVIAWIRTDRGWQAIYLGTTNANAQFQDPLYLKLSFEKGLWCLRVRSRDNSSARALRVINVQLCADMARAWMMHGSPVVC